MADAEIDAAEGMHLLVAHLVGLPEIVGDDDVSRRGAGGVAVLRLDSTAVSIAIRFSVLL